MGRRVGTALLAGVLACGAFAIGPTTPVSASPGQVVASLADGLTPEDLVETLLGGGVEVSNVTYTGADAAAGRFSGMSAVGFDSGVVLGSGQVMDVVGPNDSDDWTTTFGTPGDADLDAIVAPETTADAAVLEFDFVATSDLVQFEYVFGSEEYNEYVNSEYNDVFAFFVNGENCALIPGTGQAVAINTVNGGNPFGTGASNPQFYRNNSIDDPGPSTIDTELDGLTTVFTCSAVVTPGATNSMKLAIADTGDAELDSAVFIRAQSFVAPAPPVCSPLALSTPENTPVALVLPATDPNVGDVLAYKVLTPPANGTVSGEGANLTYTPNPGYTGTDSFTWDANDGQFDCIPAGVVTITVTAGPVAVPVTPTFTG